MVSRFSVLLDASYLPFVFTHVSLVLNGMVNKIRSYRIWE